MTLDSIINITWTYKGTLNKMGIEAKSVAILDLHHCSWPCDWWLRVLLDVSRAVHGR
jgi:hypothetical protein